MALPPWVAPARRVVLNERCGMGGEGAMGQSDEQVHSWEACLLNVQGLDAGTRNDKICRHASQLCTCSTL